MGIGTRGSNGGVQHKVEKRVKWPLGRHPVQPRKEQIRKVLLASLPRGQCLSAQSRHSSSHSCADYSLPTTGSQPSGFTRAESSYKAC